MNAREPICPYCLIKMGNRNLARHVKEVHENPLNLQCDKCGISISRAYRMRDHKEKACRGDPLLFPISCSENCGGNFKTVKQMLNHVKRSHARKAKEGAVGENEVEVDKDQEGDQETGAGDHGQGAGSQETRDEEDGERDEEVVQDAGAEDEEEGGQEEGVLEAGAQDAVLTFNARDIPIVMCLEDGDLVGAVEAFECTNVMTDILEVIDVSSIDNFTAQFEQP